jgi:hypothetical protein
MTTSTDRQQFRSILADLAAKTQAKLPALNGRVTKACKLVLAGDVELHQDGTALVGSLTDPTRTYQVTGTPGQCQCRDYDQAPEHLCCHRLAVGLTRKVQALLPQAPESTPEVHLVSTTALPEAPASCNVRLTIAGREVQWTLRDTDEARLAVRLDALLQRYPAAPGPTQASQAAHPEPEPERRFCPKDGAEMTLNHKDGRQWWSHRLEGGGFCKGK